MDPERCIRRINRAMETVADETRKRSRKKDEDSREKRRVEKARGRLRKSKL